MYFIANMSETNQRVTMIMGAGAVLDMNFPADIITPTTRKITEEVLNPYRDIFDSSRVITVVNDIYDVLIQQFPVDQYIWWRDDLRPEINFEILFHVIEQLLSYESVWSGINKNPYIEIRNRGAEEVLLGKLTILRPIL